MAPWLRISVYSSLGLLWLTGCAWLVLHLWFQVPSDFGAAPHPLQPPLMVVHGVLAVAAIFLIGWLSGTHIGPSWKRDLNRTTGLTLIVALVLLALTGLGSYYFTSEGLRSANALVHEITGVLALIPALAHWLMRPARRA